jgi:hypothetical protein
MRVKTMFAIVRGLLGKLGLRWFEWLFIGMMLTVFTASYYLYQKVGSLKIDLAKAEQAMQYNEQTEKQLVETIKVDRDISYDFFNEQMSLVRSQYQQRGSVIDEYLKTKAVNATTPVTVEPTVETHAEPEESSDPTQTVRGVPKVQTPAPCCPPIATVKEETDAPKESAINDDLDALQHLVDSMQFAYCQAKTRGGDCTSKKSVD